MRKIWLLSGLGFCQVSMRTWERSEREAKEAVMVGYRAGREVDMRRGRV